MIFVVRSDNMRDDDTLHKLYERLSAEMNSDRDGKVIVIPADCEYDIIAEDGEHLEKIREMLQ